MVIGVSDINAHTLLRSELDAVLVGENYDLAVVQVESEREQLKKIEQEALEIGEAAGFWESSPAQGVVSAGGSSVGGSHSVAAASVAAVTPSKPARGKLSRLSVSLMNFTGTGSSTANSATTAATAVDNSRSSNMLAPNNTTTDTTTPIFDKSSVVRRASILKSKAIRSIHGPRAMSEQKLEAMLKQPQNSTLNTINERDLSAIIESDSNNIEIDIRINGKLEKIQVNPILGTMAGLLTASKNTEKIESMLVDLWGGKKTKRRWYELDNENFKWCSGHEKEYEYKGIIPVSSITDIRNHTTDQNLLLTNPHSFEFETTERIFALGCENLEEKQQWLTALQISRDNSIIQKGSYKNYNKELNLKDIEKFYKMLIKQGMVFQSIAVENRRVCLTNNKVNISDCKIVNEFLRYETMAAGHSDMLLGVLQELLLIPPNARHVWEAMYMGTKVRKYYIYIIAIYY